MSAAVRGSRRRMALACRIGRPAQPPAPSPSDSRPGRSCPPATRLRCVATQVRPCLFFTFHCLFTAFLWIFTVFSMSLGVARPTTVSPDIRYSGGSDPDRPTAVPQLAQAGEELWGSIDWGRTSALRPPRLSGASLPTSAPEPEAQRWQPHPRLRLQRNGGRQWSHAKKGRDPQLDGWLSYCRLR